MEKICGRSSRAEPGGGPGVFARMSDEKVYQEPSDVSVENGVVSVKGPDAVDVKMTPEAADETSDRLLEGALKAHGQKVTDKARRKRRPTGRTWAIASDDQEGLSRE